MKISRIKIENFRGIAKCELHLKNHVVLVGDNNTGKSTILEALDLVLGPDRLSRWPVIDEHDFYGGKYLDENKSKIEIKVEVLIDELSEEQLRHFNTHLEWWNSTSKTLLDGPPPESTDQASVSPALRVGFIGVYDIEEDGFSGKTYFHSPSNENGVLESFRTADKRLCGFLFLRTLRTGSRALSLERGSLLDIILKLQDKRQLMWEDVLEALRNLPVAEEKELGIGEILQSVQDSIRKYVPSDWADAPRLRVSELTRESLRKTITVFMSTGSTSADGTDYGAPFQHQGTGTVNMIVLALLSIIAELKQNVIFAMEEPEIAIPPYTQKRIINSVRKNSSQSLFTSHSPYVLEEFDPSEIIVLRRLNGELKGVEAGFPPTVKAKAFRDEIRLRFCEALLAKRVLLTEGRTEYDAYPAAARRLQELEPATFDTLEGSAIAVVDARTQGQVAPLGAYFRSLGKSVFAVFDKQEPPDKVAIDAAVDYPFEAQEKGFENVIIKGVAEAALRRYGLKLVEDNEWPLNLNVAKPTNEMAYEELKKSMFDFFRKSKGSGEIAQLLCDCSRDEMPQFVVETLASIQQIINADTSGNEPIEDNTEEVSTANQSS